MDGICLKEIPHCYDCNKPFDVDFVYVCKNNEISQAFTGEWNAYNYAYEHNLEYINLHLYQLYLADNEHVCEVEDKHKLIIDNIDELLISRDDYKEIMTVEKIPLEWHRVD